jgi:hypothetical protein
MSPAPARSIDPFAEDDASAARASAESVDPFALIAPSMAPTPSRAAGQTPLERPTPPVPPPPIDGNYETLPPPAPKEETDPFSGLDVGRQASLGHKPLIPPPASSPAIAPALRREILGGSAGTPPPISMDPGGSETGFKARHDFIPEGVPDTGPHATGLEIKPPAGPPPARILSSRREEDEDEPQSRVLKSKAARRAREWTTTAAANILGTAFVAFVAIAVIAAARSPRPLTVADLGPDLLQLAFGSEDSPLTARLHATELQTGIYPLRSGEQLVYVQGIARNDTSRRLDAMYVSLDLMKEGHVIEHQEAVAGIEAGGEDLFELTTRKNDDLQRDLSRRTTTFAVEAHKSAPFVGVFAASVDTLQGAEVRATAHEGWPKALVKPSQPPAVQPAATDAPPAPAPEAESAPARRTGHVAAKAP